jgi:S-ribosylhomocysteine lyase
MQKIQSFQIDHNKLEPGMYISRIDGDITTYDLRTRRPNSGCYMDNSTMHSLEHMAATFFRNSSIKDQVIYFGPMGCQTGFYLLIRNADHKKVREVLKQVLRDTIRHEGEVFGCSPTECGNYRTLDIEKAKAEARLYLEILEKTEGRSMEY